MAAINAAIADYEKLTCLRFKKRTTEAGYIHFYQGGGFVSELMNSLLLGLETFDHLFYQTQQSSGLIATVVKIHKRLH